MKKTNYKYLVLVLTITLALGFAYLNLRGRDNLGSELLEADASLIQKQNDRLLEITQEISSERKVYLDPYDISPLTALITFKTDVSQSATITIKGKDGSDDFVQSFESAVEHYLPIYGLYPNYKNTVILTYGNNTEEFIIETDSLPDDFTVESKTYINEDYNEILNDDFYFVTPAAKGYTSAYDKNGNVRWYLTEKLVWEIRYLNNGNLVLSNEKVSNPPYYTTGFYELSMLGKIEKEYIIDGGYHHDLAELPNGNFIVASNSYEGGTVEDVLVEIDRVSGQIVKYIDLRTILDPSAARSENWIDFDWFHNNSIWYDEKTNSLTLSGRHQDAVVNLDYDTLGINYILTDPNMEDSVDFTSEFKKYLLTPLGDNFEWSYAQHAAKILPNGDLFLFDNGINRSKYESEYIDSNQNYSRGVIYRINQENMTVEQIFEYGKDRGSDYFSSYISDVDYLEDDHYLVHSGGVAFNGNDVLNAPPGLLEHTTLKSHTSEVYKGELIFELELDNNYYRAEKMPIYNSQKHMSLDIASSLGEFQETHPSTSYRSFFPSVTKDDQVLSDYDIELIDEGDRLKVSGNFNKEDEVSVVLYNKFKMNEYRIRISDRPYTAMCIVVFDDQKQGVTTYINNAGLENNEYTVLIKINGVTYATNTRIKF